MKRRIETKDKLPGIGLFRTLAALGAEFQIIVNGVTERLNNFANRVPLERYDVTKPDHATGKNLRFLIELDDSSVSLVLHTIVTTN